MSFNHTLSAILRGHWSLDRAWAEAHFPVVLSLLQGNPVSFVERDAIEGDELPFAVDPATMSRYNFLIPTPYGYRENPNIPEDSVGVIPVSGPITKYNGSCGEAGAMQHSNYLLQMQRRQNISSIVFLTDTPGGEARAANSITPTIRKSKKPVLALVDGMNASLGMYYTSAVKEVYLSSKSDEMGSVGSYITFFDFKEFFESKGIKKHEVYAPQSEDKNKDFRDALTGNYDMLKKDLELHVNDFIAFVKQGRPKAAAYEKEWRSGKMFYAEDAVKMGLADGIKDFQQVVSKAAWLAKRNK